MRLKDLKLDVSNLRSRLNKPLRPIWTTQDSTLVRTPFTSNEFYPILCCTSSRRVEGTEASEDGYIQGAGDDSEGWSQGLTPAIFWQHKTLLMSTTEDDLRLLIPDLVILGNFRGGCNDALLVRPTETVFIGTTGMVRDRGVDDFDCIVVCCDTVSRQDPADSDHVKKVLSLQCGTGKLGSKALRTQLPRIHAFITSITARVPRPRMLVTCSTGKDLSVGIALSILCFYFDDNCRRPISLINAICLHF